MTKTEHETRERFAERYRVVPAEVSRRIERRGVRAFMQAGDGTGRP